MNSNECKEANKWEVYIVQTRSGKLYTGITNNMERRLDERPAVLLAQRPRPAEHSRSRLPVAHTSQANSRDLQTRVAEPHVFHFPSPRVSPLPRALVLVTPLPCRPLAGRARQSAMCNRPILRPPSDRRGAASGRGAGRSAHRLRLDHCDSSGPLRRRVVIRPICRLSIADGW